MDKQYSNKELFFGFIKIPSADPWAYIYGDFSPCYEVYFINSTDNPVTIKDKNITVEPHSYTFYCSLYQYDFTGAARYQTIINTDSGDLVLSFYLSGGAGFLGSLIPCLDKYGRIIHPYITNIAGK